MFIYLRLLPASRAFGSTGTAFKPEYSDVILGDSSIFNEVYRMQLCCILNALQVTAINSSGS
jgi:hypothetical protein